MLTCERCGRPLGRDDVGLTRKLIDCLAQMFEVTRQDLEKKIEEFRQMGCTLFL